MFPIRRVLILNAPAEREETMADVLTVLDLQAQFDDVLERVVKDRAPVLVTRGDREAVVLVPWLSMRLMKPRAT